MNKQTKNRSGKGEGVRNPFCMAYTSPPLTSASPEQI